MASRDPYIVGLEPRVGDAVATVVFSNLAVPRVDTVPVAAPANDAQRASTLLVPPAAWTVAGDRGLRAHVDAHMHASMSLVAIQAARDGAASVLWNAERIVQAVCALIGAEALEAAAGEGDGPGAAPRPLLRVRVGLPQPWRRNAGDDAAHAARVEAAERERNAYHQGGGTRQRLEDAVFVANRALELIFGGAILEAEEQRQEEEDVRRRGVQLEAPEASREGEQEQEEVESVPDSLPPLEEFEPDEEPVEGSVASSAAAVVGSVRIAGGGDPGVEATGVNAPEAAAPEAAAPEDADPFGVWAAMGDADWTEEQVEEKTKSLRAHLEAVVKDPARWEGKNEAHKKWAVGDGGELTDDAQTQLAAIVEEFERVQAQMVQRARRLRDAVEAGKEAQAKWTAADKDIERWNAVSHRRHALSVALAHALLAGVMGEHAPALFFSDGDADEIGKSDDWQFAEKLLAALEAADSDVVLLGELVEVLRLVAA